MAKSRPHPTAFRVRLLLTGLVAFGPVSTDLYLPSLPAMVTSFRTDVSTVQLTLSVFVFGFAVSQLIYGPLSDRFGRRPVLLGGIATYFIASILCLFAPSIHWLIVGRLLQALGACAGPVVGRAVVRDVYPRDQAARVLSYMASAMALMPAVAPIFGGVMESTVGWQGNFALLALFGVVLLIGTWTLLDETNHHTDAHALQLWKVFGNYRLLLRDRRFIGRVLTLAFGFAGLFSFISGSSFVLIDVLKVDAHMFGFAFGCVVFGYVAGTFLSGRIGQRIGLARMIRFGIVLGIVAGASLALLAWLGVQSVVAVVLPTSFYFLSVGLVLPNTTAAAIAPYPTMAGSASAMLGFIQMAVGAVAGWLVGASHDGTTIPMASVLFAMTVAAALAHGSVPGESPSR